MKFEKEFSFLYICGCLGLKYESKHSGKGLMLDIVVVDNKDFAPMLSDLGVFG